jgi:hydroxymethylglutaryl-CoA reductase
MVARGGGVINMHVRSFKKSSAFNAPESFMKLTDSKKNSRWLIIHLIIDVCDAMGANAASTVAEQVAPYLSKLTGARAGVRIVSNYTVERRYFPLFISISYMNI